MSRWTLPAYIYLRSGKRRAGLLSYSGDSAIDRGRGLRKLVSAKLLAASNYAAATNANLRGRADCGWLPITGGPFSGGNFPRCYGLNERVTREIGIGTALELLNPFVACLRRDLEK